VVLLAIDAAPLQVVVCACVVSETVVHEAVPSDDAPVVEVSLAVSVASGEIPVADVAVTAGGFGASVAPTAFETVVGSTT
jgi:hypothetical protein